jgi:hypothetical protein
LINLYFFDDILLFLEANPYYIEVLKWILVVFEDLFGLKINYDKCEMVILDISSEEGTTLADILGCKLSSLSITYLGVPLHFQKLKAEHWNILIKKIKKKLQGWKGKITLLNYVISVVFLYWMSIYRLPTHVRNEIDRIRKIFFWYGRGDNSTRKKYHLVSWDVVCKSKSQGGLGVLDLKIMNTALLAK